MRRASHHAASFGPIRRRQSLPVEGSGWQRSGQGGFVRSAERILLSGTHTGMLSIACRIPRLRYPGRAADSRHTGHGRFTCTNEHPIPQAVTALLEHHEQKGRRPPALELSRWTQLHMNEMAQLIEHSKWSGGVAIAVNICHIE